MRIQLIEMKTQRPIANTKVQLQIKGKDSGFLTLTTDGNGHITLDGKYNGQQIAVTNGAEQGQWIPAIEGAKLTTLASATTCCAKQQETTTTKK